MTARPAERRRAEAFAAALDGGGPANLDREVERLVHVAEALCRAEVESPRPEFARDLRTRLMDEAATALTPRKVVKKVVRVRPVAPPKPALGFRRRLAAAAATFAIAGGSFGLVSESAQALPGEMLYPVKRGVENAQLTLDRGPSSVGSARLGLAQERLEEVKALVARGDSDAREAELVSRTLDDFSTQAHQGADSLFRSYADHGHRRTVAKVTSFADSSSRTLASLSDTLPESTGDSYAAATRTLVELNSRAGRVCSVCAVPSLTDLPASLRSQVQELTGSDPGAAAGGDGRNGTSKDPVATGRADGPGSGSKNDSGPTTKSPAGVPSIGPDLPDVEVPGSQEPGSSSPSVVPTPRTPNLDDPVRKATKPIEKLLDPVLSGLLGSGQQGSAGSNPDRSGTGDNSTDQGGKTGGTDSGRSGGDGSGSGSGGDGGGLIPGLLGGLTDN